MAALQSVVESRKFGDYAAVMIISAVGYDYILTFSREVEYIWTLDLDLYNVCSRSLSRALLVYHKCARWQYLYDWPFESTAVYLVSIWTFAVFLSVADLMMILRVYVMWNRSRRILRVLLFIYMVQTIFYIIYAGLYINPDTYLLVMISQVQDFSGSSFCDFLLNVPSNLTIYFMIPRFVLSLVLLILALAQTLKESVEFYKATRRWQPNRYMKLLLKDGIVYFFMNLLYITVETILSGTAFTTSNPSIIFLVCFVYLLFATIMPRFIISMRELYSRDLRARWQGDHTGFGALSQPIASRRGALSAMASADVPLGQDRVVEGDADDSGAIRLVEVVRAVGVRLE